MAGGSAPSVEAIFLARGAGLAPERVAAAEALVGRGLRGDRYAEGTGYYSRWDPCELTLIEGEVLDAIAAGTGLRVGAGEHRRNVVTRGVRLRELGPGARLRLGAEVEVEWERPRPPCAYVERLTQPGMTRALGNGAGVAVRIVRPGLLREGDAIALLAEPQPTRRLP